jgi:hypothetical protein
MSFSERFLQLSAFGLLAFLVSCASYPDRDENQSKCPAHLHENRKLYGSDPSDSSTPRPSGNVVPMRIRFTDDGEKVNRCEETNIFQELKSNKDPQVIVLYVHGWKHNAGYDSLGENNKRVIGDSDWKEFMNFLGQLRAYEETTSSPRQVVGIYVGWNGQATTVPILEEFTFWSRKGAADRLTQSAALTKFLGQIRHIRDMVHQPRDLVVFIGHSFGARILYSATAGLLLYDSQMKHPGYMGGQYGIIKSPADLVVLLNPAFEAHRYTAFESLVRSEESFASQQLPLLLTIATTNDWATGSAFPLGQVFGFEFRTRQRTTLGNFSPYFTHRLLPRAKLAAEPSTQLGLPWFDSFCASDVCMEKNSDTVKRTIPSGLPFIVATTDKDVLDGHNGVWKGNFLRWLSAFIVNLDSRKNPPAQ